MPIDLDDPPWERLSDEERARHGAALRRLDLARHARCAVDNAFTPLFVFSSLDDGGRKRAYEKLLEEKPGYWEEGISRVWAHARALEVSEARVRSSIAAMRQALLAGREPSKALYRIFREAHEEALVKLRALPASFDKTIAWAKLDREDMRGALVLTGPFVEHPEVDPSYMAGLARRASELEFHDLINRRADPTAQEAAAYVLAQAVDPEVHRALLEEVEEDVERQLAEIVPSWRSHLGQDLQFREMIHSAGPQPAPVEVASNLYHWCAASSLRRRFADRLVELAEVLLRLQGPNGAWACWVRDPEGPGAATFTRHDCPLTTAFAANALHDLGEAADFSEPIDRARTWLVRQQRPDGSVADVTGEAEYTALVTALLCRLVARRSDGPPPP